MVTHLLSVMEIHFTSNNQETKRNQAFSHFFNSDIVRTFPRVPQTLDPVKVLQDCSINEVNQYIVSFFHRFQVQYCQGKIVKSWHKYLIQFQHHPRTEKNVSLFSDFLNNTNQNELELTRVMLLNPKNFYANEDGMIYFQVYDKKMKKIISFTS